MDILNTVIHPVDRISEEDSQYLDHLRGALILRVVLGHLGLGWILLPYSSYFSIFFPALFMTSGAICYFSFIRAQRSMSFIKRRTIGLFTTYAVVTIAAFAIFAMATSKFEVNTSNVIDWLLVNMNSENTPYRMGQIWFLRALILITIITIPFFILSRKNINFLLIPTILSIILSACQSGFKIGSSFQIDLGDSLNTYNLYHPLVNMGYYTFGAWLFSSGTITHKRILSVMLVVVTTIVIIFLVYYGKLPALGDHAYYQDLYYLSWGYLGALVLWLFKSQLQFVFSLKILSKFMLFLSKHAFAIFLVHSYFIDFSEIYFGWKSIMHLPNLAFLKVVFVISMSCLVAIPITAVSKKVSKSLVRRI